MLTLLTIKNFALIDTLEIDFSKGFSIITGETGAGKSILLGALGLLQGKRADLGSLKDKQEKCIIEGHFSIQGYKLENLFDILDIDYEPITIIRREILPSGKSRAFVNDSPINLSDLQELSKVLIDIHSQAQTGELQEQAYQISILDAVANNEQILEQYQNKLKTYKKLSSDLKRFSSEREELLKQQDYNDFLLEELEQADLAHLNQEELEQEFEKLNHVEVVLESFSHSSQILNQDQIGIVSALKDLKHTLGKVVNVSVEYQDLWNRLNSVEIELADIGNEMDSILDSVMQDPERMEIIQTRLQQLYGLLKKHQVNTTAELIEIYQDLSQKAFLVTDLEHEINKAQKQIDQLDIELKDLATKLSVSRQKAVPELAKQIVEILKLVGMPNSRFQFDFCVSENYLINGQDQIQLLFSANKGMDFGLLKKVASGGEMSRIMLAIKATLAKYSSLPTIIFDEIDTGVSGEVADKMGQIMRDMSTHMQVFAITHLPQIAAKGNQHYKVFKTSNETTTTSQLVELDTQQRIEEIAQMLSGKELTSSALGHAKALLGV